MKYNLIIILFIFGIKGFSQEKQETTFIEFKTQLEYGSSNLNNEFMGKLLFGGKIDNELKNKILSNTSNSNRFGFEFNYEITVTILDTILPKYPNHTYYIGFGSFQNINATYSRDFFKTLFYGNKSFAGNTAKLGSTNFIDSKFEKITFGILHKNRNSSLGISLIIGDRHNSFNFSKADLYTATDGRKLNLDYEGTIKQSDSLNDAFFAFSGTGVALDFRHVFIKKIGLTVSNFGFAVWKRNTNYSKAKKSYNYTGLEIDNILNIKNNEIEIRAKELLPETKKEGFVTVLPATIRLDRMFEQGKNFQFIYGAKYKLASNYFPKLYLGGHYNVNRTFGFNGALNYGGYSNLRLSAGAYFNFDKIYAGIETINLIEIFNKNSQSNGIGFYLFTHF